MKVEAIDHLHFCVPDLGRAQALLGTFAGGECTHAYGGDDAWWNCHVVYNSVGLEIMQPVRDGERIVGTKESRRKGVIAVALRVDDLDARVPQAEALGTTNALGLRLLQPLSEAGELGRRIATAGEGVHAIVFAVDDLDRGIATAQAAGLRLLTRGGGPGDRPEAEFDAADSWGMTVKLTERRRG